MFSTVFGRSLIITTKTLFLIPKSSPPGLRQNRNTSQGWTSPAQASIPGRNGGSLQESPALLLLGGAGRWPHSPPPLLWRTWMGGSAQLHDSVNPAPPSDHISLPESRRVEPQRLGYNHVHVLQLLDVGVIRWLLQIQEGGVTTSKHERLVEEQKMTTHMSAEEVVHLLLNSAVTLGVGGQQVAGEAQSAAGGFVARQEEDESLPHDFILGHHLLLRTSERRLLRVAVVLIRRFGARHRLVSVVRRVELVQRRTLFARSSVQHQLQEVSAPLPK